MINYHELRQRSKAQENSGIILAVCMGFAMLLVICVMFAGCAQASQYTNEDLANAIYKAEGTARTHHPYGILANYKHTTPRQACINTIISARKRFAKQTAQNDFVHFLSLTYCPIGAHNDPTNLNINWEHNVKAGL